MKKFSSKEHESDCRICGYNEGSPLAIARAITEKVLQKERLHAHKLGYEYYFFIRGKARLMIGKKTINVKAGDVIMIEPNEKHRLIKVIEELDYITIKTNNSLSDKIIF